MTPLEPFVFKKKKDELGSPLRIIYSFEDRLSIPAYNRLSCNTAAPSESIHLSAHLANLVHTDCIAVVSFEDNPQPAAASNHDLPADLLVGDNNYPYSANLYNHLVLT